MTRKYEAPASGGIRTQGPSKPRHPNTNSEDHSTPSGNTAPLAPADDAVWDRVAPTAVWRNCAKHGYAPRPAVRERQFKNSGTHLEALCPQCGKHLGYLTQKRPARVVNVEEMRAEYQFYLRAAIAKGHKPGHAYYRFLHNFGRVPDPEWAATQ